MTVSVIIPVLNEAARLPGLLAALDRDAADHEVIVVDGGSTDGSVAWLRGRAVRLIETPPGRGRQLVAGADAARGEVLWFLHADTRLPDGALAAIGSRLDEHPAAVGGNFRLLFDGDDRFSRWLDGFYAWIRARGYYYGDSGIFVRRAVYDAIGGLQPIALMEDYDFIRRMERFGTTICIDAPPLVSSSRRFRGRSPAAIVAGWFLIHGLFHLGVPPDWLAWSYDSRRRRTTDDAPRQAPAPHSRASFRDQSYS